MSRAEYVKERQRYRVRLIARWKRLRGCAVCSSREGLELDHIQRGTKKHTTANGAALNYLWGMKRIKAELSICQVLCTSCHRDKTAHESVDPSALRDEKATLLNRIKVIDALLNL